MLKKLGWNNFFTATFKNVSGINKETDVAHFYLWLILVEELYKNLLKKRLPSTP